MPYSRTAYRPPAAPRPHSHRLPGVIYWRRRSIVMLVVAAVVFVGYLVATLFFALLNPSYGSSLSTRASQWGDQHGLASVVHWVAHEAYHWDLPKKSGTPPAGSFGTGAITKTFATSIALAPPVDIVSPTKTPLPGEGVWHVAGRETATGIPTMYEAFVRPDAIHTSYVVGVVWMDPTLLQAQLYSGSSIPGGGPYPYTAPISAKNSENLVAAFNAGFLMPDANGGYYTDGRTILPRRNGAASVVIFKDGTMTVGKWGSDVTMSAQVASVRQNLDLIVDNAKPVPGLTNANLLKWGKTLGGSFNVWRSGLGVTKDGALIYVGGPSLSIADLANVLVRAGAVRAMELDINTDWVQFSAFQGPLNTPINGG